MLRSNPSASRPAAEQREHPPSVPSETDDSLSLFRAGPGAKTASTGNETGVSHLEQLRESLAHVSSPKLSITQRIAKALTQSVDFSKERNSATQAWDRAKSVSVALWDAYSRPAAVLRLADAGSISLDEHVGSLVPEVQGADKIAIRDLLTQRSGLPDVNGLPDYDEVLQYHQTPSSLIAKIAGRPLLFEPGSKSLHEEHSAYNLLALIVEKRSAVPFAAAVERLVFRPIGLSASGVDDDSLSNATHMAKGYEPQGTYGLKPARTIHWSAKTGNGSAYTTIGDAARRVDALFLSGLLSPASRNLVLDSSTRVGYGWFRGKNRRFSEIAYYMNGRAPGFSSFVLYMPDSKLTVVVLSNVYSSATTTIGYDIAALSLGLPYERLQLGKSRVDSAKLKRCTGTFQFGPDFYQANAKVSLVARGQEL